MKTFYVIMFTLLVFVLLTLPCVAAETANSGSIINTNPLENAVPDGAKHIIQGADADSPNSLSDLLNPGKLLGILFSDVKKVFSSALGDMLKILAAVLIFAFAREVTDTLNSKSVTPALSIVAVLSLSALLYSSVLSAYNSTLSAVSDVTAFGHTLTLVMSTAIAATGGITSAGAVSLTVTMVINAFLNLLLQFLAPVLNIYFALLLAEAVSTNLNVSSVTKLIKSVIITTLGIFTTLSVGILSLQRTVTGATDALAINATKFAVGTIPVIGSIVKDTTGTLISSVGIIKSSAGVFGILVVAFTLFIPLLTAFSYSLLLRLLGGLCGMFDKSRVTSLIQGAAGIWDIIIAVTLAQGIFVIISVAIMIKTGGQAW